MFDTKKESFPEKEEKVLKFWKDNQIFEKSVASREKSKLFSFYDGPPFATGLPHYGHLLAGTIKDVVPRYKTMKGYCVPRRFGWDCHGLPVENEIEKEEKLYGAKSIEEFGIANFNQKCSEIVLRYTAEWEKTVNRMGRWVDFTHTYKTMDLSFMESVWWVFKRLFDMGLVYKGFKVMPFSAQLGTPLSNFEANLNYKEVDDPSITVAFKEKDQESTYFLAWTTTPWTLISNLALAVGEDIDYVKIKDKKNNRLYILAKDRLSFYFAEDSFELIEEFKGKDLIGKNYEPLFDYFKTTKGAFRIIGADFVSTEEGTGIVHTAPAFGEVDFFACKKENIDLVCPVDNNGHFTDEVTAYAGMPVKDADKLIIRDLKERKILFSQKTLRHRYPFCWRSDTPLIYKAVDTWFIKVEEIKDKIIASNKKIHWVPSHIKEGRFGKWLENARDWAISRNRYWGTPIPIWMAEDGEVRVFGDIKELEKKTNKKIDNLHRQFIDDLTFEENGKTYRRIPEVFDCWFESGSMPYAQNHYPFENKKITEEGFPADFIAEGLDQTRGWFYTLNIISTALFGEPAFKNVIVNGIILASDGNKMSKRLKNYPDPQEVIEKYGADAIRLYMLHSPAVAAEDLRFTTEGVELVIRQILLPFWNSYFFLSTYVNIYNWKPSKYPFNKPKAAIDRWAISCLHRLIHEVEEAMDVYELAKAIDPIVTFVDQLTNWYIRRSRTRFWSDKDTPDRREAFETLYTILLELSKIAAPFIPFLTESIFHQLKLPTMPESVHLCDYPSYDESIRDENLEREMSYIQRAVALGHSLRKEHKIKVRQPLSKAHIVAANKDVLAFFDKQRHLIQEELNVKDIELHEEEGKFIQLIARPNFRVLGKKIGKLMPKVQKQLSLLSQEDLKKFLTNKKLSLQVEGQDIVLTDEDMTVDRKVLESIAAASDEEIAVAYDTTITDDLLLEGIAREIVNKVNTLRKEKNFEVTDRIHLILETTDQVKRAIEKFKDYITSEILALDISYRKNQGLEVDLNKEKTKIELQKASK